MSDDIENTAARQAATQRQGEVFRVRVRIPSLGVDINPDEYEWESIEHSQNAQREASK